MAQGEMFKTTFYWNISKDVGRGKPNLIDDVELVRYGYHCMRQDHVYMQRFGSEFRTAVMAMDSRGPYGADLQNVIDAHQRHRGGTQDGCVSVMKINTLQTVKYDGQHSWILWSLHLSMVVALRNLYPRIDLDSFSGPDISRTVRNCFLIDSAG